MKILEGQQTLMRIFIGEQKKHAHQPLYQAILETLRKENLAGATVLRGIAGFGAKSHLHSANLLTLSQDLPMVIECVDTRENIDRVLPKIEDIISDGLLTLENVDVIRYGPKRTE